MTESTRDQRGEASEKPRQFQDKKDPDPRPDQPTTSDDATLVERGDGAHAEFSTAPETLAEGPPPEAPGDADESDDH